MSLSLDIALPARFSGSKTPTYNASRRTRGFRELGSIRSSIVSDHQNPVFREGGESKVVSGTESKDAQRGEEVTVLTTAKVREPDVEWPRMGTTSRNFQRAVDDDDGDAHRNFLFADQMNPLYTTGG